MRKSIILALLIVFVAVSLSACSLVPPASQPDSSPTPSPAVPSATVSAQPTTDGQVLEFIAETQDVNVLQATQRRATVELKEYDFGAMVVSLNGQAANQERYWALYLNDAYAVAGPSKTLLKPGDKVKWVFEKIEQGL